MKRIYTLKTNQMVMPNICREKKKLGNTKTKDLHKNKKKKQVIAQDGNYDLEILEVSTFKNLNISS